MTRRPPARRICGFHAMHTTRHTPVPSRTLVAIIAVAATATAADVHPQEYTLEMTDAHVLTLAADPRVSPAPSAMRANPGSEGLRAFVLGDTPGTEGGGYQWRDRDVPSLPIHALRISDDSKPGGKLAVVVQGGNHSNETHSTQAMDGMIRYFLSDDPPARKLLEIAEILYYPQINPEGRWAFHGTRLPKNAGTPEQPGRDPNRNWHNPEEPHGPQQRPYSHIVLIQDAQRFDTGGRAIEAFFDFHSPGGLGGGNRRMFTYSNYQDRKLELMRELSARTPVFSYRPGQADTFRIARGYALRDTRNGGLGAAFSYTPEIGERPEIADYHYYGALIGRAFALQTTEGLPANTGSGRFLIDLQHSRTVDGPGWNTIRAADTGKSRSLTDDRGEPTTARVYLPPAKASDNAGWSANRPRPEWLPAAAAEDCLYFQDAYGMVHFDVHGLAPGRSYDVEIVSARDLDRSMLVNAGQQIVPATDGRKVLSTRARGEDGPVIDWNERRDGHRAGKTLLLEGIRANPAGRIRFKATEIGRSWGISAIRIQERP